jgi:mono/diheme cytochrome c family protein
MNSPTLWKRGVLVCLSSLGILAVSLAGCGGSNNDPPASNPPPASTPPPASELPVGPANAGTPPAHTLGNAANGQTVFRFETFGNERFWTDAIRLPAGMVAAGVTPLQALALGLHVDIDAVPAATRTALMAELAADPSGKSSAVLNDPENTVALINANAVIGLPPKDTDGNGTIDILAGDKVGATCALCHTITDGSGFNMPTGGSIGRRQDGRATHTLDFGTLLSLGTNSRAYYPALQLALTANGGKTLGRAPTGLTENSTEAQVDAYLTNKNFYPVGMFDDTVDGNGDPMHNMPLFRQDLAFPYGSEGAISKQDNFANLVYTALLDPTTLLTPGGRAFLRKLGGDAAGTEIADDYAIVLAATGVTGPFPYVQAAPPGDPALAGTEGFPLGVRVDNAKLNDMNAYLFGLAAPAGMAGDAASIGRGRALFQTTGCTDCHNVDQARFVPTFIVPMKTIFPGDNPVVLLPARMPPLNPILNTPGNIFDDKMAVVNASLRGLERGTGLPLLLDLARKPVFLHDNSVPSLDALFNPSRGTSAPHPFYFSDTVQRDDIVQFMRSLGTN